MCVDCGRSFVATINSIVAGTKKILSVRELYINCAMEGTTLTKTAAICGIMFRLQIPTVLLCYRLKVAKPRKVSIISNTPTAILANRGNLYGDLRAFQATLIWYNFVNYAQETAEEKRNIFLIFVLLTFKTDKCRDGFWCVII